MGVQGMQPLQQGGKTERPGQGFAGRRRFAIGQKENRAGQTLSAQGCRKLLAVTKTDDSESQGPAHRIPHSLRISSSDHLIAFMCKLFGQAGA